MSKISFYILIFICINSYYSQKLLLDQPDNQIYQVLRRKEIKQYQQADLETIENIQNKNKYSLIVNKHANQMIDIDRDEQFLGYVIPTLSVQDDNPINQQGDQNYDWYADYGKEFSFFLNLGGQKMRMILQTYSNIFIVQSDLCTRCDRYYDNLYKVYSCNYQQTCSKQEKRVSSKYYQDIFLDGYVSKDELEIGGVKMKTAEFLAIFHTQNISYTRQGYYYQGVIGFGAEKKGSLINKMYKKRLIQRNLFCLQINYFLGEKPQITFGEFNSLYHKQLVHYFQLIEGSQQWKIQMQKIQIANQVIFNQKYKDQTRDLIIAVNVKYILMNSIDFQQLVNILNKNVNIKIIDQYRLTFECSELDYQTIFPTIQFTLEDLNKNLITYTLTPQDYVNLYLFQSFQEQYCTLKIKPIKENEWVIGEIFLKHTYSIFNYEKSAIGFIDLLQLKQQTNKTEGKQEEDQEEEEEEEEEEKVQVEEKQEKQVEIKSQKSQQLSILAFYFLLLLCLLVIIAYIYKMKYCVQSQSNSQDNGTQLLPLNDNQY